MKRILSLLVLWSLTIHAATVYVPNGTGSPLLNLGAGKTPALQPVAGVDSGNNLVPLLVNADGSLQVTGGSGGGSGGDASAANQVIGNASLNSIDTKTPALVGGKQPVVIDKADSSVLVSGQSPVGSTPALNPVSVSGVDAGGLKRHLLTDTAGKVQVYDSSLDTKLPSLVGGDVPIALNDGAGNAVTSSVAGTQRPLDVQLHNAAGNPFGTSGSPLRVDPTGSTTQPVSAASLPLPSGAATEATLSAVSAKLPSTSSVLPDRTTSAQPVSVKGQQIFRTTFANSIAGGVDSSFWSIPTIGTGMTVNQSAGNLVITSGTTINDETIIRSNQSFKGNLELKWSTILSQRIVNNNFYVELVDIIGDGLAYTINSATSVTVTIPSNPFTSANVGQALIMQGITGTAGTIPGRYVIASVAGNNVTFTVAGFPATGTGTLSLVGWNYVRAYYNGAVATAAVIETQRRGYNTGSSFTAAVNTTAAPGHLGTVAVEDGQVSLLDQLQAAAATLNLTRRAEIIQSLPEENTSMFLQIHAVNGTVAPASTTTWTLGMAQVATRVAQNVAINSISAMSQNTQLPVNVLNTPAVTVSSGTVTTVSTVTAMTSGNLGIPSLIADVASAALTTTTTTATLIPTFGTSYMVSIPVTIVSGTLPTLDIVVQESDDTGTNWFDVYHFQRITATGIYRSPILPFTGNRIRYVQTVGGTTPSFTRAINRLQTSWNGAQLVRQLLDRTISLTTLSATTASLTIDGCRNLELTVNIGTATTAPTLQLQVSEDGSNWVNVGSTILAVASSTVKTTVAGNTGKFARAIVTSAGSTVVSGFVQVKGYQ